MPDEQGFVRRSLVLPGNVSEPSTLQEAMSRLGAEHGQLTVVMDACIVSETNIAWLRERGCQWIVVGRRRCPAAHECEPDCNLRTSDGHRVRIWSSAADDEVRLRLLSRGREHTERSINDAHRLRLEEALVRLREGLTMPRR